MVSAEDIASLHVLDHPVSKTGNMARGLKDWCRREDGGVDLEHAFLDDEVLAPFGDNVGL